MQSLAVRHAPARCANCLGPAELFFGEVDGEPFRVVRCLVCGDALVEASKCPLCDAPADRYVLGRTLFAVYSCSAGCLPFAFDATAEEALRRSDYGGAREALRLRVRVEGAHGPLHPLLVTGRIVEDVRSRLDDEAAARGHA